ncbi:MAG: SPFH domain-containing protein [Patescibacteria group bacterium]|jgi:regulator of protease activity HflC (stomatin/prohibitin superfamily)
MRSAIALPLCVIFFFGILIKAAYDGWVIVPQKWDYIIEIFGVYIGYPLKEGWYIFFPWFKFIRIRNVVFKGDQLMELYLDENTKDGYGGGDVEFEDCSSSLKAFLYFRIIDSEKSTYETNDLFRAVEEKTDSLLRSFLGLYKLEEVIKMKSNFYLEAIVMLIDFCPDTPLSEDEKDNLKKDIEAKWKSRDSYTSLMKWGVEPLSLVISDIKLTKSLDQARQVVLTAEKELEVANIKQKQADVDNVTKIKNAEADKTVSIKKSEAKKQHEILLGEGIAAQITKIVNAGVPKGQIGRLLIKNKQWESIEKGGNTVTIIEDGGSGKEASRGANFGSGFNSTTKK